jgi:hypothetical protein
MKQIDKKDKEKTTASLIARYEYLKEDRAQFEPLWKQCEWNVAPVIQDWENEKPKNPYKIPNRVTNQPTNYLNVCVDGIAGYAMSPNIKWFKLGVHDSGLDEDSGVTQWLEKCEQVMRRTFERCGFYQTSRRWLELSGIYGQSAILIEELRGQDAPIRFHVPEMQELYLDNNDTGQTETVFRTYWSDIENLVNHYGLNAMHENVQRTYNELQERATPFNRSDTSIKILHAVYLRRTGKPDYGEIVENKKWASVIIDLSHKHIIKESGYDEFPYAMFFWERTGKPYGISPTMKAINDIAIYQEAFKSLLVFAEKTANPPIQVPESWRGKENFQPGGLTYFRNPEMRASQLEVGTNYPVAENVVQILSQNVREWYNVDFFLMLRNQKSIQNMTATAIAAMQGEQAALLSALVSNLFDGLNLVIKRTFNILAKKRLLPEMPFALRVQGGSMKVDFLGVLAQAQKAAYEYTGVMDVLAVAGQFAQFGKVDPEFGKVINWIKPETVFRKAIESRGAPADVLRTREEYDNFMAGINAQEEAQAAQAAQAQANQAVLQNAQNLNDKVKPGSLLEQVTQGNTPGGMFGSKG